MKKIIVGALAVLGAMFLALTLFANLFIDCYSETVTSIVSSDSRLVASQENTSCDEKPMEITLWVGERNENEKTMIFSAVTTTNKPIEVTWRGSNNLYVNYPNALKPKYRYESFEEVSIQFDTYNPK